MFNKPFSFPRFILHLFCLVSSALLIFLNKFLLGSIQEAPLWLFNAVISFYLGIYVLISLSGVLKKIEKHESKIVQKELKQNLDCLPSDNTISKITNNNRDFKLIDYDKEMEKAEKTWKSTPKLKRNNYENYLYYSYLISIYSKVICIIAAFYLGFFSLNTDKISIDTAFKLTVITFGLLMINSCITRYLTQKIKKYKNTFPPKGEE